MNQTIYKAMRAHLNTLANKPPIAYLNQPFTPTGVQYLREGFYSASPDHMAIEYGGMTCASSGLATGAARRVRGFGLRISAMCVGARTTVWVFGVVAITYK